MSGDGRVLWRTDVPTSPLVPPKAVKGSNDRPFNRPAASWIPARPKPLLVSGNRVLAGFTDMPSTGVGIAFGLDLGSGTLRWSTLWQPLDEMAALGDGSFLVGAQGYGAFRTTQHDSEGRIVCAWQSHGRMVVQPDGRVRVIELENILPSKSHVAMLLPDGTVERRAPLPGYYTSELAALSDGTVVFWREGALFEATPEGALRRLAEVGPKGGQTWACLAWDGARALAVAVTTPMPTDEGYTEQSILAEFELETARPE